ncbi:MAG: insulinase family protein [Burkholderiales bacterium]|nr:insulinase family protein [Burkholderiales bacterium]
MTLRRPGFALALVALVALAACVVALPARAGLPIQSWTAPSGARVLFVEARGIPMLDIAVDFDAGGRRAPPGKAGLAGLTNSLLAMGAGGLDENRIAEGFADAGAQRGARADADRAGLTLRTLSARAEREAALALFAAVLQSPTFPEEAVSREKARAIAALREAETKPEAIANRVFYEALYGAHPYGASASPASVAAIDRADIEAFYRANYGAARAVVSIIGDIARAEAEVIAERLTAGLPAGGAAPALPAVGTPEARSRRLAHPATQSHILLGVPALARGDPDFFALTVGNHVLGGGGFVSRLMQEVREKRGLAYSAYSYFLPLADAGPFQLGLQTKKEQADQALALVREVVAAFVEKGPTAAELKAAKANLTGGFPLRIDNNRKILDNLAVIGFYRLPLDYLDRWVANVERVTAADVRAAFARRVRPDGLVTVVVGAPD